MDDNGTLTSKVFRLFAGRLAILASLGGIPAAEIANQLGSNRNAIYKLIHDARKRLKAGLEESGVTASQIQLLFAGDK